MTDERVEQIARVCHEANRGLQRSFPEPGIPVAPLWDAFAIEFPEQADGVREGVHKAMLGATPEELHESWCERKRAEGWTHGPAKDSAARTHPCLLPYDQLPVEQRRKDVLFSQIVNTLSGRSTYDDRDFSPGERAIMLELRAVRRDLSELQQEVDEVDAAGEALQNEINALDADVKAENEEIVNAGAAIVTAGDKFAELKALLEKQASGALTDEEAGKLTTLATEVDTHLKEGTTQLTEHVKVLGEDAAAA